MTRNKAAVLTVGALIASAVSVQLAIAQSKDDWRDATAETQQPKLMLSQSYRGTRPGDGNNLPRVTELKEKSGLWITWPGFMMTEDGGSRVFLQTTGPVKYTQKKTGKKEIVLVFRKTGIYLSNNRNPLVTGHFNTPVARVNLKRRSGKTTELVMKLKVESTPNISQMTDNDGYNYLFIDFPAGEYPQTGNSETRSSYSSSTNADVVTDYAVPEEIQE
jgi:hypothetical protein